MRQGELPMARRVASEARRVANDARRVANEARRVANLPNYLSPHICGFAICGTYLRIVHHPHNLKLLQLPPSSAIWTRPN